MRLEHARFHAIGPFAGSFELDLRSLKGPIVGVIAPNGTGKTWCLESSTFGACYRDMPTQGSLVGRALGRDAVLESTIVYGRRYKLRHLIDAVSRKSKAVVLDEHDQPVYEGDGIPAFKTWAARHLPDRDVLAATTFAVQSSGGFLGLGSAERVDVILRAIHLARIERAAVRARRYAGEASGKLDALRLRIADARQGAADPVIVEIELAELRHSLARAEQRQASTRASLVAAEEAERAATTARAAREALDRDLAAARGRMADLERRLSEAGDPESVRLGAEVHGAIYAGQRGALLWLEAEERDLSDRRTAAGAARAARARIEGDLAAARERADAADAAVAETRAVIERSEELRRAALVQEACTREIATAGPREREARAGERREADVVVSADRRSEGLRSRLERAEEAARGREAVEAAESSLPALEARVAEARSVVEALDRRLADLAEQRLHGAEQRIAGLEAGHEAVIAAPESEAHGIARGALERSRAAGAAAAEAPALIAGAEAERRAAVDALEAAERTEREARAVAARRVTVESAEAERDAVRVELRDLEAARERAEREADRWGVLGGMLRLRLRYLQAKLLEVGERAALAGDLAGADARLEERERAAAAARAEAVRLQEELAAAPVPEELPPPREFGKLRETVPIGEECARTAGAAAASVAAARRELEPQVADVRARVQALEAERATLPPVPGVTDVELARAEAESAERVAKGLTADVARLEQRLEQAKAATIRTARLDVERLELEADLSDWNRLALDCGRDGIQSAEVDSVGPELTELTNDLLHQAHGPRYTVSIETKRAKADGKGETDECRVMVIDTVAGTEKEAREHSGGERVILGEAVSLALTMIACRRAGLEDCSIIRDESGAALDPENARVYVAMLRRAAKFVRARHVLLVSHLPIVQSLCDDVIHIPSRGEAVSNAGAAA